MAIPAPARVLAAAGVALAVCASASADVLVWDFTPGMPGSYDLNNAGGAVGSIHTTFDTVTKQLEFTVNFTNQITKGYWLALNGGPNPKSHSGEMALFYFDAQSLASPKLTAYAFNGQNAPNSWQDGSPAGGNQTPDLIKGVNESASWIQSISAMNVGAGRTLSFVIDATDIINHTPMYPDAVDPWTGTGYGDELGIWMHPVTNFNAAYTGTRGKINSLSLGTQGWLDGSFLPTTRIVPAPGAAALAGMGGLVLLRRRRRA